MKRRLGALLAVAVTLLAAHTVLVHFATAQGWAAGLLAGRVTATGFLVVALLVVRLVLFLGAPAALGGLVAGAAGRRWLG